MQAPLKSAEQVRNKQNMTQSITPVKTRCLSQESGGDRSLKSILKVRRSQSAKRVSFGDDQVIYVYNAVVEVIKQAEEISRPAEAPITVVEKVEQQLNILETSPMPDQNIEAKLKILLEMEKPKKKFTLQRSINIKLGGKQGYQRRSSGGGHSRTICSKCGDPKPTRRVCDMPEHTYHEKCLGDNQKVCYICAMNMG